MPEYLEISVDKFTFKVALDRFYTRDGVWIMPATSGGESVVRLGLTDYLQQHSGDVAFVNLRKSGTKLSAGDDFAEIETIKVNLGLPSPIAGTITDINKALELNPEFVNLDPYEKGWLVEIKPEGWEKAVHALLNAHAYLDFMKIKIDRELRETK